MPIIDVQTLHQRLAHPESAPLLIDVRTPGEYRSGHVPGAINVPLDSEPPEALASRVTGRGPVHVICQSGGRSARCCEALARAGAADAVTVEGGTGAWQKAGFPLERAAGGGTISLERQVRIAAGALVVLGVVLGWTVAPAFFALSAFVGAGLVFAGVTDTCGMAMMLAKMPWNQR